MMRCGDCPGRTSGDAAFACSASILLRRIEWQLESRQDFAEEKPRAHARIDQHGAFAVPAHARLGSVIAFQNRAGINVTLLLAAEFP